MIEAEAQYRAWMLAGLAGDGAAYAKLLSGLAGHLRAYFAKRIGPSAAEDLVQETLIAMHVKRATYDPALPLTAWVHGIARYKLIDEFRRARRRASVPLEDAPDLLAEDDVTPATAHRDVEKLLAKLPPAKRALVKAIKLDGATVEDTAKASGLSPSAVKVAVHRAVKSLGDDLRKEDGDSDEN